jgi:hypothetical protein
MLAFVLNVKERNDDRSEARVTQVDGSEGSFYGLNAPTFAVSMRAATSAKIALQL